MLSVVDCFSKLRLVRLIEASVVLFFSPFPMVAEAVQEELESYKMQEDEVRRLKRAMVFGDSRAFRFMLGCIDRSGSCVVRFQ